MKQASSPWKASPLWLDPTTLLNVLMKIPCDKCPVTLKQELPLQGEISLLTARLDDIMTPVCYSTVTFIHNERML